MNNLNRCHDCGQSIDAEADLAALRAVCEEVAGELRKWKGEIGMSQLDRLADRLSPRKEQA